MRIKILFILIITLLLSSCMNNGVDNNIEDDLIDEQEMITETIKILVPVRGQEETLKEVIEKNNLDIDVEFIYASYSGSIMDRRIELEQYLIEREIDLVYPGHHYQLWAESGLLYSLDHFMQEPSFHGEEIHSAILERYRVNGEVYGLSPFYNNFVLAYNKDIYDQIDSDYPQDQMTWDEVFQLASKVKEHNPEVYGIEIAISYLFLHHLGVTKNLGYFHDSDQDVKFEINTEEWKELWEKVERLFKEEVLYISPYVYENNEDVFYSGNAGISFGVGAIYRLKNDDRFPWDIVTEPVHPDLRNEAISVDYSIDLISISSSSSKVDLAWEVIKSINGSSYSQQLSQSDDFIPLSRTSHINTNKEFNVSAYYSLSSGNMHYKDVYTNMPKYFDTYKLEESISREFDLVIRGDKSVSEALQVLQSIGEELIVEALHHENVDDD